jgi:lysozyme family protein
MVGTKVLRTPRDAFVEAIAVWEGGFQAYPEDLGNWVTFPDGRRVCVGTNRGVTPAALARHRGVPAHEITVDAIKALTIEEAAAIGVALYYEAPRFSLLPWCAATEVWVDVGWGSGPRTAIRALQRLSGAADDGAIGPETVGAYRRWLGGASPAARVDAIAAWRREFYRQIVERRSANRKFLQGWLNRATYYTPANAAWWRHWSPAATPDAPTPAKPSAETALLDDILQRTGKNTGSSA